MALLPHKTRQEHILLKSSCQRPDLGSRSDCSNVGGKTPFGSQVGSLASWFHNKPSHWSKDYWTVPSTSPASNKPDSLFYYTVHITGLKQKSSSRECTGHAIRQWHRQLVTNKTAQGYSFIQSLHHQPFLVEHWGYNSGKDRYRTCMRGGMCKRIIKAWLEL